MPRPPPHASLFPVRPSGMEQKHTRRGKGKARLCQRGNCPGRTGQMRECWAAKASTGGKSVADTLRHVLVIPVDKFHFVCAPVTGHAPIAFAAGVGYLRGISVWLCDDGVDTDNSNLCIAWRYCRGTENVERSEVQPQWSRVSPHALNPCSAPPPAFIPCRDGGGGGGEATSPADKWRGDPCPPVMATPASAMSWSSPIWEGADSARCKMLLVCRTA